MPEKTECPTGDRLLIGYSPIGATLFGGVFGFSTNFTINLTVPWSSVQHFNLKGSQISGTGTFTVLGGLGAFAGFGNSGSLGSVHSAQKPYFSTSKNWDLQAGAGDGGGVEVSSGLGRAAAGTFGGSMAGPRAAIGAYGAFGRQYNATYASPLMGCQ